MPSITTTRPSAQVHLERGRELERMGVPEAARVEFERAADAEPEDYPTARTALVRLARCELRCHRPFDSYRAWARLIALADGEDDPATSGYAHERAGLVALERLAEPRGAHVHLREAQLRYVAAGLDEAAARCDTRTIRARHRLGEPRADAQRRWSRGIAHRLIRVAQVPPHGSVLVRGCKPVDIVASLVGGLPAVHVQLSDTDEDVVTRTADAVSALGAWDRVRVGVSSATDDVAGWFDAIVDLQPNRTGASSIGVALHHLTVGGRFVELRALRDGEGGLQDEVLGATFTDRWVEPVPLVVSPARTWLHWRIARFA